MYCKKKSDFHIQRNCLSAIKCSCWIVFHTLYYRAPVCQLLDSTCPLLFSLPLLCSVCLCCLMSRNNPHSQQCKYYWVSSFLLFAVVLIWSFQLPSGWTEWRTGRGRAGAWGSSFSPLSHMILFHCVDVSIIILPLLYYCLSLVLIYLRTDLAFGL